MKIDKKLIKELVDNLKEFELTELEYQDSQTKIKVSKASKGTEQLKTSAVVSQNKAVLKSSDDSEGIRVKSPIIGTAYLAPEPGAKKFVEVGDKIKKGQTVIKVDKKYYRPSDVDFLKGDPSKAKKILKWTPKISFAELVKDMVMHDVKILNDIK